MKVTTFIRGDKPDSIANLVTPPTLLRRTNTAAFANRDDEDNVEIAETPWRRLISRLAITEVSNSGSGTFTTAGIAAPKPRSSFHATSPQGYPPTKKRHQPERQSRIPCCYILRCGNVNMMVTFTGCGRLSSTLTM